VREMTVIAVLGGSCSINWPAVPGLARTRRLSHVGQTLAESETVGTMLGVGGMGVKVIGI